MNERHKVVINGLYLSKFGKYIAKPTGLLHGLNGSHIVMYNRMDEDGDILPYRSHSELFLFEHTLITNWFAKQWAKFIWWMADGD